jgi:hypothetical protein
MGKLKAVAELFEGRHFDREVIILCVRVRFAPSRTHLFKPDASTATAGLRVRFPCSAQQHLVRMLLADRRPAEPEQRWWSA